MAMLQIDPTWIAGDNALIWGCFVVIGALATTVAFLAKRLFVKSDEFVKQHQDLLKENLQTLNNVVHSLDKIADEVPRMSAEVRTKIAAEAVSTRTHVSTQLDRVRELVKHGDT